MTITLEQTTIVDDFRRKGCGCVHCKGPKGNPNETHGSGAPLVKHPTTGKDVTYRRPSSMGKPLEDTYHLDLWAKRTVLYGAAVSPSLVAQAANLDPATDKAKLNELAEAAIVAGKGAQAADLGTAMHSVVEKLNLGVWTIDDVPDVFRTDAEAYLSELERHGLAIVDGHAELKVVNDIVRAAGTFDMILNDYVSDLKTGQSVDMGQVGIGVQLATYRWGMLYHVPTDTRSPLPPTSDSVALVVHLPYGTGTCRIIDVDLQLGWEAAQLAASAKSWNYRKDLFTDRPAPPSVGTSPVETLATASPGVAGGSGVVPAAPAAVGKPRKKKAPPKIVPTAPLEPVVVNTWQAPDEGRTMDDGDMLALRKAAGELDGDAIRRIKNWQREAGQVGRPIATAGLASERRYEISRAMLWLAILPDERVRDLLTIVLDEEVQPATTIGCALGTLTTAEANELAHIARCDTEPQAFTELTAMAEVDEW